MKHHIQTIIIMVISIVNLQSQEIIFPGLRGDSLITELKKYYTPKTVLPYDQARTKLYTEIFLQNDSIECYYSGYKIPVPLETNILSWTAKYGIQTEHLFPRSFGAASLLALLNRNFWLLQERDLEAVIENFNLSLTVKK